VHAVHVVANPKSLSLHKPMGIVAMRCMRKGLRPRASEPQCTEVRAQSSTVQSPDRERRRTASAHQHLSSRTVAAARLFASRRRRRAGRPVACRRLFSSRSAA